MPNEVVLFGASGLALTVFATFVATLLLRWRQRPLPSFSPVPVTRFQRIFFR